jgi:hypothetical protein
LLPRCESYYVYLINQADRRGMTIFPDDTLLNHWDIFLPGRKGKNETGLAGDDELI